MQAVSPPEPALHASGEPAWPDDAIEVGRIAGAWGVKGWLKVQPFASQPEALFSSRRWFLAPPETPAPRAEAAQRLPRLLEVHEAREHAGGVVAKAQDVEDRNAVEALRGCRIFVSRASFPTPDPDEYYWVDLIGLAVRNREGQELGAVVGLIDTGPQSVLRVAPAVAADGEAQERLIPFVSAYVLDVDLPARQITVDWGLDY